MKRLFTILLAVLSLLSLTACGGSPTEETSQVHVEAQGGEKEVLLSGICQHGLHAAGGISFLERGTWRPADGDWS